MLVVASGLLILHGLIHLMGTTVYMKLGKIEGLPYKTTLLGSRWNLGERGMWLFGALWVFPAVGFVLCGIALFVGWAWWLPLAMGCALFSLVLTGLDWSAAYAGAIVNLLILGMIWFGADLVTRFL
jgi:hypothetical protein